MRGKEKLIALLAATAILTGNAVAAEVTLTWDPAIGIVSGYKIYYGNTPGAYSTTIDVGNTQEYTITNLDPLQDYYFTATAYNDYGESNYSDEIRWPGPPQQIENLSYNINNKTITFSWTTPKKTGAGKTIPENIDIAGVEIRYTTGSASPPATHDQGLLSTTVQCEAEQNTSADIPVTPGLTYNFSFFVYDAHDPPNFSVPTSLSITILPKVPIINIAPNQK